MSTIFETGTNSHAVNELVIYTENTEKLAGERDGIYKRIDQQLSGQLLDISNTRLVNRLCRQFLNLFEQAKKQYLSEFDEANHILHLTKKQRREYLLIYLGYFMDWRKYNRA
jgi:hypothetical protein